MPLLHIDDLHVYLAGSYVIQGVSLDIDSGCVAILGRNGVGKSTLLRAIMGLTEPPRRGSLSWRGGIELTGLPAWRRSRLGIGYVPQGRRIFPSLSVEENLIVARNSAKTTEAWSLDELYDLFPTLREHRRQPGTSLSGGEQQMLAIARAMIDNPRLIILDEPSEGLAPIMVQRLIDTLDEVRQRGHSLLLVEQNFRMAGALADRVCVMQAGRIVRQEDQTTPAAVSALAERYLGVMNEKSSLT